MSKPKTVLPVDFLDLMNHSRGLKDDPENQYTAAETPLTIAKAPLVEADWPWGERLTKRKQQEGLDHG